jgi:hypothetical protein
VVRIIDMEKSGVLGHCITSGTKAESAVSWSQTGPRGPQRLQGLQGKTRPARPARDLRGADGVRRWRK